MEVSSESRDGAVVVSASGPIDHATAGSFEAAVMPALEDAQAQGQGLVFDLSGVDYMSSVGLRVLMLVAKAAKTKQTPVAVASLQPSLAEIFQISRFDKIFNVYGDVQAALDEIKA